MLEKAIYKKFFLGKNNRGWKSLIVQSCLAGSETSRAGLAMLFEMLPVWFSFNLWNICCNKSSSSRHHILNLSSQRWTRGCHCDVFSMSQISIPITSNLKFSSSRRWTRGSSSWSWRAPSRQSSPSRCTTINLVVMQPPKYKIQQTRNREHLKWNEFTNPCF